MNNTIPVFVFPNCINYSEGIQTQTITLYNPYDFNIKYSLLCTKPNAFSLSSSEGVIRSRFCLDIVIRLLDETIIEEKFLIKVIDYQNPNRLGEKLFIVYKRNLNEINNDFEERTAFSPIIQTQVNNSSEINSREFNRIQTNNRTSNNVITYLSAFICILILLLPHESSQNNWLTICFTHKLVVAYILGLLTVVILRN